MAYLETFTTDQLREALREYEDRLAALPPWRWLARRIYAAAIRGLTHRIILRT